MAMTVSVAMATHMGAAHLREQLTSILEQSMPPAEIVVCDDRSSDGTAELILAFAEESPVPVRLVVNEERLGWRANFMKAASLCESELVAFCDQDDVWDPRKLELVVAAFEDAETLMVFHDATVVASDLDPVGPFLQGVGEPDRAGALQRSPWSDVYGFTIAFRSELLALWGHWPSSLDKSVNGQRAAHDQWLLFLGSALGTTVHLPERLTSYRQHDRNAVGAKDALHRTARIDELLRRRDVLNLRLVVLDSRIRILGEVARQRVRYAGGAASALKQYKSYRDRLGLQTAVYSSTSLLERLRAFATLLLRRSYAGGPWAPGQRMVADDGLAALLGPDVLARLRRRRSDRLAGRARSPRRSPER